MLGRNRYLSALTGLLLLFGCNTQDKNNGIDYPKILDDRLTLELIETDPRIVTPIGLTIDSRDDIYVLESHTHQRPGDYTGPEFDRIKKGIDSDGDGKPDSWKIFADSINDGMNLACGPDDIIYLVEKDGVKSFQDMDGDGVSDKANRILRMNPPENVYDHAGMLGVAVSPDGWLYISRGNTGSQAWQIEGTDGRTIGGYGDGGNVMRCRPDGTLLEKVATGFWNPFDLKFSYEGRLLLIDNDPDSRGPNRLLEVVPGGDYGYGSLYGGSGIHPFLAWNGELPGTLPYAAALGEAPSGMLDATFTSFPADYQDNILSTIWEENTIVRVPLQPHKSSVTGKAEIIVQGDSLFHPVAIAVNSHGDIYITDWVVRQYPNHGKGRIWRLSSNAMERIEPREKNSLIKNKQSFISLYENVRDIDQLIELLQSGDAFKQTVARKILSSPIHQVELLKLIEKDDPELRLQALLTITRTSIDLDKRIIENLLADNHPDIRRMTLIYIATHSRDDLMPVVKGSLQKGNVTPDLFETYLATVRHLQPEFINNYKSRSERYSNQLKPTLPPGHVLSIIKDKDLPDEIRAAAMPYLKDPAENIPALIALLNEASPRLQIALLKLFKNINNDEVAEAALKAATDTGLDKEVRAQAFITLEYQSGNFCDEVFSVFEEQDKSLTESTIRYLCRCSDNQKINKAVEKFLSGRSVPDTVNEIWRFCNGRRDNDRPENTQQWMQVVDGSGSARKGSLIFQLPKTQCLTCHKVNGWGGEYGPDLSQIGSSKSREQLISAIVEPSGEISPEWQGWYVKTKDGTTHIGRQIDVGFDDAELLTMTDEFVTYKDPVDYGLLPASLMPEGLENTLTKTEFNHLITYLMSLK